MERMLGPQDAENRYLKQAGMHREQHKKSVDWRAVLRGEVLTYKEQFKKTPETKKYRLFQFKNVLHDALPDVEWATPGGDQKKEKPQAHATEVAELQPDSSSEYRGLIVVDHSGHAESSNPEAHHEKHQTITQRQDANAQEAVQLDTEKLQPEYQYKPPIIPNLAPFTQQQAETELKPTRHEDSSVEQYIGTTPEKVLEGVEAAAEKGVPLERSYERRHEIKDEPGGHAAESDNDASASAPQHNTGSTNGGDIAAIATSLEQSQQAASHLPHSGRITALYKQAILTGLAGAVIVLLLILLVKIIG